MSQQPYTPGIPPTSNQPNQPPGGSNGRFTPAPLSNQNPQFQPINPQFQPQPSQPCQFKPLAAPTFTSPTAMSNPGMKPLGVQPGQPPAVQQFKPATFTPMQPQGQPPTPAAAGGFQPQQPQQQTGQFQPAVGAAPQFKPLTTSPTPAGQLPGMAPKFQPIGAIGGGAAGTTGPAPITSPTAPGGFKPLAAPSFKPLAPPSGTSGVGGSLPTPSAPAGSTPGLNQSLATPPAQAPPAGGMNSSMQPPQQVPGSLSTGLTAPSFAAPKFQPAPLPGSIAPPSSTVGQAPGMSMPLPPPSSSTTGVPSPGFQMPPPASAIGAIPSIATGPGGSNMPLPPPQHQQPGVFNPQQAGMPPPPSGPEVDLMPPPASGLMPPPASGLMPPPASGLMPPQGYHGGDPSVQPQYHPPQHGGTSAQDVFPSYIRPAHPHYITPCSYVFPLTTTLYSRAQLPQGVIVKPFAMANDTTGPLPLVDFSQHVIRCDICRAYINPYVKFIDNGKGWVCNFCNSRNATHDNYMSPLDHNGNRVDIFSRPELVDACYEMLASPDYIARTPDGIRPPPPPPTYCFVINVSNSALSTGYLSTICQTIKESIDMMLHNTKDPNNSNSQPRCRVAFITYDTYCHYYEFKPNKTLPHMHVDTSYPAGKPPLPSGIHFNLQECYQQVMDFLDLLPTMFTYDPQIIQQTESCFGTALGAVLAGLPSIGVHVIAFSSQIPTVGQGKLPPRDNILKAGHKLEVVDRLINNKSNTSTTPKDPKATGAAAAAGGAGDKSKQAPGAPSQMTTGQKFYDEIAFDYSRLNVALDLFIVTPVPPQMYHQQQTNDPSQLIAQPSSMNPTSSVDLAAVVTVTHHTGGDCYYYPHYLTKAHGMGLASDLKSILTQPLAWDAVYRLRVSLGAQIDDVYGNFSIRGNSLIVLPTISPSKTLTFEFRPSPSPPPNLRHIFVQGALLYTNSYGQRVIRIYTLALPLTQDPLELFNKADSNAIASLIAKQCIGMAINDGGGLLKARQHMLTRVVNIFKSFKTIQDRPDFNYNHMTSLPLLGLGFAKCLAIRDSEVPIDLRVYHLYRMISMAIPQIESFLRPRLLPLHGLTNVYSNNSGDDQLGMPIGDASSSTTTTTGPRLNVTLPPEISLSMNNLTSNGLYLIDNGFYIFIFVGNEYQPPHYHDLFETSPHNSTILALKPLPNDPQQQQQQHKQQQRHHVAVLQKIHNIIRHLQAPDVSSSTCQTVYVVHQSQQPYPTEFTSMFIEDISANVMSIHQFSQFINKG